MTPGFTGTAARSVFSGGPWKDCGSEDCVGRVEGPGLSRGAKAGPGESRRTLEPSSRGRTEGLSLTRDKVPGVHSGTEGRHDPSRGHTSTGLKSTKASEPPQGHPGRRCVSRGETRTVTTGTGTESVSTGQVGSKLGDGSLERKMKDVIGRESSSLRTQRRWSRYPLTFTSEKIEVGPLERVDKNSVRGDTEQ